jgi:hypothetical protein
MHLLERRQTHSVREHDVQYLDNVTPFGIEIVQESDRSQCNVRNGRRVVLLNLTIQSVTTGSPFPEPATQLSEQPQLLLFQRNSK